MKMIPFCNITVTVLRNTVMIKPARLAVTHVLRDLALTCSDNISLGPG